MSTSFVVSSTPTIQPYQHNGKWYWMNVGQLAVLLQLSGTSVSVTVPDGFTTDLASIPKLAQWAFALNPYEPNVVLAALVHDWLSPTPAERLDSANVFGERPMFPPTISAGVFYELMKWNKVSPLRRRVYYHAVVLTIPKELW